MRAFNTGSKQYISILCSSILLSMLSWADLLNPLPGGLSAETTHPLPLLTITLISPVLWWNFFNFFFLTIQVIGWAIHPTFTLVTWAFSFEVYWTRIQLSIYLGYLNSFEIKQISLYHWGWVGFSLRIGPKRLEYPILNIVTLWLDQFTAQYFMNTNFTMMEAPMECHHLAISLCTLITWSSKKCWWAPWQAQTVAWTAHCPKCKQWNGDLWYWDWKKWEWWVVNHFWI